MAMTAKTKKSRIDNLDKQIAALADRKRKAQKAAQEYQGQIAALEQERAWIESAPTSDGQPELPAEELPVEVERTVVPAASPAEVASTPAVDRALDAKFRPVAPEA